MQGDKMILRSLILRSLRSLSVLLVACCMMANSWAQPTAKGEAFPNRIIKIVVPFAPGGPADTLARPLAEALGKRLGQPVIVENRAGANAAIASQYVARSSPDGYTLLFASDAGMSLAPATQKTLPYDPAKDFLAVSMVAQLTQVLFVHDSVPARSVKELAALAQKSPGSVSYASIGTGSQSHVSMEAINRILGVKMTHIPYAGAAPALNDVLAGRVQVMLSSVAGPLPHIKSGRLRALAFAGPDRSKILPDTPTLAEAGVPNFESRGWFGIVAPAKTPPEVIKILSDNIWAIVQSDSYMSQIVEARGFDIATVAPNEFPAFLTRDQLKWKTLVEQLGDSVK
jgi:tripartite-type tricarboxylate transporter receptor subunit TctC